MTVPETINILKEILPEIRIKLPNGTYWCVRNKINFESDLYILEI